MNIIVTEQQFKLLVDEAAIISEQQSAVPVDSSSLILLQNKINDLLDKKEKEVLDKTVIKLSGNQTTLTLEIGSNKYPMQQSAQDRNSFALVIPPKSRLPFGGIQMTSLLPEIQKLKEYQAIVQSHPEIKDQVDQGIVKGMIWTDEQNQGEFIFRTSRDLPDRKDMKSAVPYGTPYPLGEFIERNKLIYRLTNGYGVLESGNLSIALTGLKLNITAPVVPQAATPVEVNKIDLQDMFVKDDIKFTDDAKADQQIQSFINEISANIQKIGQPYIEHIQKQNPTVYGYASIDGDPKQSIQGGFPGCAGNRTRADYDKCLSTERARLVAEKLNKAFSKNGITFKFQGMGETMQFNNIGWAQQTAQNPPSSVDTAPNRRVMVQIQPYTWTQPTTGQTTPPPAAPTTQPT